MKTEKTLNKKVILLLVFCLLFNFLSAQKVTTFNLAELHQKGQLISNNRAVSVASEKNKTFIKIDSARAGQGGEILLPIENFSNGTIEMVARGKDIHQGSFYGISFHGQKVRQRDDVYCRPFNFRAEDAQRKIHAVQYVSYPDYDWFRLRSEYNGHYEKGIVNPPNATDWVRLKVVIKDDLVKAYINDAPEPSLVVKKLNSRTTGKVGISGFNCDIESVKIIHDTESDSKTHRFFMTSDGVRLHYRVEGVGEPLVIFPGYGQAASTFDKVYAELKKHYTVYCLDYRWLGKSYSPTYGYHIERFAKDAKEMIDDAKIDKFNLFAHSMGNTVAWCYFSLFGQEKVNKYILGDEAPCLISDPFWTDKEVETYTGSTSRKEMFKAWRPSTKPENMTLEQDMMSRLLNDHLGRDWRDILPTIKIPTMIVMGGKSHFSSPLLWEWLHKTIKGSRLEIMKEAGHGFYDSHPDEFNRLTMVFLEK